MNLYMRCIIIYIENRLMWNEVTKTAGFVNLFTSIVDMSKNFIIVSKWKLFIWWPFVYLLIMYLYRLDSRKPYTIYI